MKSIPLISLLLVLLIQASAKTVQRSLKLSEFPKEGPFIFLTKFHLAPGHSQMDIIYTKGQQLPSQPFYNDVSIAMVNHTVLTQFLATESCNDRLRYVYKRERFYFRQERHGMKHVKLYDIQQEQLWYFYFFSCVQDHEALTKSNEQISLTFSVVSNGSHFGESPRLLYAYIVVVLIWGYLIFRYADSIGYLLTMKRPDGLKIAIFGGLIMLGAAYLYRLIHIILFSFDGLGVHFFQILYVVLKNIGEALITTLLIVIAWGWSILHLKASKIIIFLGFLAGTVNIICLTFAFPEENEEFQHHYDTSAGIIVLFLRIILFLIFIIGIFSSLNKSSSYIIYFIKKLAVIGGAYLLSWPAMVLLVQCTLPDYLQHQIIIMLEQVIHLSICILICNMTSSPESAYRMVSLQQDDNPFKMKDYKN